MCLPYLKFSDLFPETLIYLASLSTQGMCFHRQKSCAEFPNPDPFHVLGISTPVQACTIDNMCLYTKKNDFVDVVCEQQRCRPACASTQSDQRLCYSLIGKHNTVKSVLSGHSKRRPKLIFKTDYCLMQVKSIAECSKRTLCKTFELH